MVNVVNVISDTVNKINENLSQISIILMLQLRMMKMTIFIIKY